MKNKIKVHDGIVGSLILLSFILTVKVNEQWVYLAGAISVLMIVSSVTGSRLFFFNTVMLDPKDKCCS